MQSSAAPAKISVPFANSGAKNTIPVPSQVSTDIALASFTDGFPPATRTAIAAGGKAPYGTDMNGILNAITIIQQWQSAGGLFKYDSAFSTAIGGYPKGATLISSTGTQHWINTVEGNTTDPDGASAAGWFCAEGNYRPVAPTLLANTTLTNADAGKFFALGNSGLTLTLPLLSSVQPGATFALQTGSGSWTVAAAGSDKFAFNASQQSSVALGVGDSLVIVSDGAYWRTTGGSAALKYSPVFAASFATSGYQKLPSGFIMQWGSFTSSSSADVPVTFPIAFPNNLLSVGLSLNTVGANMATFNSQSASGFNAACWSTSGSRTVLGALYIAIGY